MAKEGPSTVLPALLVAVALYGLPVAMAVDCFIVYKAFFNRWIMSAVVLYAAWYWYDWDSPVNGAEHYDRLARHINKDGIFAEAMAYFPIRVHQPVKEERVCLYGYHPHSILPFAPIVLSLDTKNRITPKTGTISFHFRVPLWRELVLFCGFVDVRRESCAHILRKRSLLVVPGGAKEAMDAFHPSGMLLRMRRGFFDFAIRQGVPVVPVLADGELGLFEPVSPSFVPGAHFEAFRRLFYRATGMTLPLFKGGGAWGLLPRAWPLEVFVGRAIDSVGHSVESLSEAYTAELYRLHAENIKRGGPLVIIHV